mmetsp:Transcript_7274/g.26371  ORF Transcript_7274/g.26371 Transcript_7274/m.26371 type:complete len:222 (-) Transcript_7274:2554-3219(-)
MGPCPPGGQGGGQARALLQRVRGGLPRACEPRGGPRRQVGRWRRRQGDISRTGGLLLGAPPVHPQAERGQGAKDHCEWHDRPRLERQLGLALLAPEAQAHLHPQPGDRPDDQEVYRPQGLKAQDLGGGVDLGGPGQELARQRQADRVQDRGLAHRKHAGGARQRLQPSDAVPYEGWGHLLVQELRRGRILEHSKGGGHAGEHGLQGPHDQAQRRQTFARRQ